MINLNQGIEKYIRLINKVADQYYYLEERVFILRKIYETESKGLELKFRDEHWLLCLILWDNVITMLGTLVDQTDKSISIVLLLKRNYKKYSESEQVSLELPILEKMGFKFPFKLKEPAVEGSFIDNLKMFRNKFGRVHLDELMALDSVKEQADYLKHRFSASDVLQFLVLLQEALGILFKRVNLSVKDSPIINGRDRAFKLIDRFK